jgi:hypothetical protein
LYVPNSECKKATWYGQIGDDNTKVSVNMTRNTKSYRLRRRAWDRGFCIKSSITRCVTTTDADQSKLWQHINRVSRPKSMPSSARFAITTSNPWTSPNGPAWSFLILWARSASVKTFKGITSGEEHPAIKGIHDHIAVLGLLQTVPQCLNLLSVVPGAAGDRWRRQKRCASRPTGLRESNS